MKKSSQIQLRTNKKLLTTLLSNGLSNGQENSITSYPKHVKISSQKNLNFLPDIDDDN
jgi:hypothetical protein